MRRAQCAKIYRGPGKPQRNNLPMLTFFHSTSPAVPVRLYDFALAYDQKKS
jgi:hypothetical protein